MKEYAGSNLLVDICHLPQFNLFKNFIIDNRKKYNIDVLVMDRGRLVSIARNELPDDVNIKVIGDYGKNNGLISLVFLVIIPRLFQLWKIIRSEKYNLVLSSAWYANLIAYIHNLPNVIFTDDPRPLIKNIWQLSATEIYLPYFYKPQGKFKNYNCLKEWSYLNPGDLTLNKGVLSNYKLKEKSYIFVREVSVKSANYSNQLSNSILSVAEKIPNDIPVLLSLEDKSFKEKYPGHWVVLEEPVQHIHSLMYFSKIVISSGDSMAREGAILGVKSLYVGEREMPANEVLEEEGMLEKIKIEALPEKVNEIYSKKYDDQEKYRKRLDQKWQRIDEVLDKIVENYM